MAFHVRMAERCCISASGSGRMQTHFEEQWCFRRGGMQT